MPGGPPAVTVFQEIPPSPEELAREAGVVPPPDAPAEAEPEPAPEPEPEPEPEPAPAPQADAEPVHQTESIRHEYDAGRLSAIVIEEGDRVTRIVRGDDGWTVHPG